MKQLLITIAMVLALSMNAEAAAQKHRHTPRTEQVDSTKTKDAIEAFSDTTSTSEDSIAARTKTVTITSSGIDDPDQVIKEVLSNIGEKEIAGIFIVLGTLFILFVLLPIIIIIAVVFFINRNRRERLKLAEMAMKNGQPIPDQLLKEEAVQNDSEYRKGVRQMFTGLGLAIFLGIVAGGVGFGIGALVFCIGLGKWYIARQAGQTGNNSQYNNTSNFNNNSNIQDYDEKTDAL